jgi:hypothetical protein
MWWSGLFYLTLLLANQVFQLDFLLGTELVQIRYLLLLARYYIVERLQGIFLKRQLTL